MSALMDGVRQLEMGQCGIGYNSMEWGGIAWDNRVWWKTLHHQRIESYNQNIRE